MKGIKSVDDIIFGDTDELCSGVANCRVLNLELYTYRRQKLTLLHIFTDLFRKEIFLTSWNECKDGKRSK